MEAPSFHSSSQLKRIQYRFLPYLLITFKILKSGVSLRRIITARFPFIFKANSRPATLSIELTDACDLKCTYCNNPLFENPRVFMNVQVFEQMRNHLEEFKIDRVRVGGGEPTLHPKFRTFSEQLAASTKFLSIVTNAQWKKESIIPSLLENYDLIELSVDCGGREVYESSRKGADYDLLLRNIKALYELRNQTGSKAHINVRFMIRPSVDSVKHEELGRWKPYCDTIMYQYVLKHQESEYDEDVFKSNSVEASSFPTCTLPFKDIQVRANGNVPLCQVAGSAITEEKRKIIGNVKTNSLRSLWNGAALENIRRAHLQRDEASMMICQGCKGC